MTALQHPRFGCHCLQASRGFLFGCAQAKNADWSFNSQFRQELFKSDLQEIKHEIPVIQLPCKIIDHSPLKNLIPPGIKTPVFFQKVFFFLILQVLISTYPDTRFFP